MVFSKEFQEDVLRYVEDALNGDSEIVGVEFQMDGGRLQVSSTKSFENEYGELNIQVILKKKE